VGYNGIMAMIRSGNIFDDLEATQAAEQFRELLTTPGVRVERIVSLGQATPEGKWLDQDRPEFVLLLAGSAALLFEGESAPRVLRPGDYVEIPAHWRHRVAWTDRAQPTVWLALHYG
jgi:cupin 2 domain-containing protein